MPSSVNNVAPSSHTCVAATFLYGLQVYLPAGKTPCLGLISDGYRQRASLAYLWQCSLQAEKASCHALGTQAEQAG